MGKPNGLPPPQPDESMREVVAKLRHLLPKWWYDGDNKAISNQEGITQILALTRQEFAKGADCPTCEGSGEWGGPGINDRCGDCNGTGKKPKGDEKGRQGFESDEQASTSKGASSAERLDRPDRENFLSDLRLLEERKTSPEWIAMKYSAKLSEPNMEASND